MSGNHLVRCKPTGQLGHLEQVHAFVPLTEGEEPAKPEIVGYLGDYEDVPVPIIIGNYYEVADPCLNPFCAARGTLVADPFQFAAGRIVCVLRSPGEHQAPPGADNIRTLCKVRDCDGNEDSVYAFNLRPIDLSLPAAYNPGLFIDVEYRWSGVREQALIKHVGFDRHEDGSIEAKYVLEYNGETYTRWQSQLVHNKPRFLPGNRFQGIATGHTYTVKVVRTAAHPEADSYKGRTGGCYVVCTDGGWSDTEDREIYRPVSRFREGDRVDTALTPSGWIRATVVGIEADEDDNILVRLKDAEGRVYLRYEAYLFHETPVFGLGDEVEWKYESGSSWTVAQRATLAAVRTCAHWNWSFGDPGEPDDPKIPSGCVYGLSQAEAFPSIHINDSNRCRCARNKDTDDTQLVWGLKCPYSHGLDWCAFSKGILQSAFEEEGLHPAGWVLLDAPAWSRGLHTPLFTTREEAERAAEASNYDGVQVVSTRPLPEKPSYQVGDFVQDRFPPGHIGLVTNIRDGDGWLEVSGLRGMPFISPKSVTKVPDDVTFGLKVLLPPQASDGLLCSPSNPEYLQDFGARPFHYSQDVWQSVPGAGSVLAITGGLLTFLSPPSASGSELGAHKSSHLTHVLKVVAGKDPNPNPPSANVCTDERGGWFREVFVTQIDPIKFMLAKKKRDSMPLADEVNRFFRGREAV